MNRKSCTPGVIKIILLLGASLLLAGYADELSVSQLRVEPTPASQNSNQIVAGNLTPLSGEESDAIDAAKQKEKEIQLEKLKQVPIELKNIDFKNFSYPTNDYGTIRLKNNEYRFPYPDTPRGGVSFGTFEVYYADLTGDGKKEAIVELDVVKCGGSCDGGSDFFYVYTVREKKPELIWHFETGSWAFGCGVKDLSITKGQLALDVYGRCDVKNKALDLKYRSDNLGKFSTENATQFIFGFNGARIVQKKKAFQITPAESAKNTRANINVIDQD